MRNRIILTLMFIMIAIGSLSSESTELINLEKAITLAKSNNIDLKTATLELSGKRRGKKSAYNVFYPTIGGIATYSRSNEVPNPLSGLTQENLSYGYEASFTFTPALFSAVTLLKKDYELGEITYAQAVINMERAVKDVFYQIILLREQASLLEDNLKTIESRYELTKLNYNAGLVSELDLLQVQVSLENFKPGLSNIKNAYNVALMNFKNLLGIDLDQEIKIIGEINPEVINITVDEAFNMALRNNLDIQKMVKTTEFLKARKSAEFTQKFIPALSISYGNAFNVQDPRSNSWSGQDDVGSFKLKLMYSFDALLPNSKQRLEIEEIERSITDIGYKETALLDGVRLNITNLVNTLSNSLKIQRGLELTVDLAFKSLGKVEQAYKAGTAQLLEVENAENEYKKARVELLREKYNYTISSLKLNSIISGQ